jgi:FdhD protein
MAWRMGQASDGARQVADEVPVALSYNGASYAVLLATPDDLEDFATGFSLTEGIIDAASEIEDMTTHLGNNGIVLRIWLPEARQERLRARQRRMAGPAGCGLCGIESLAEAARKPRRVSANARFLPEDIEDAVAALRDHQPLGDATRAVHAAGFWHPRRGMVAVREDVGRHNALDKLAGCLARMAEPAHEGIVVLTSRVSVELVQKAAVLNAGVLAAVSAPTGLALESAEAAGLTLIAIARDDGFELFTHPDRVLIPELAIVWRSGT